jgi:UDP-N-acetylmuramate--alanine ligase
MNKLPYKKIYFVGIKGVGMASLAVIAKQAGYEVRGSDVSDSFITDSLLSILSISVDSGFEKSDIQAFIDSGIKSTLVIVTAAHEGLNNPQAVYAKEHASDVVTFGQALGMFQYGTLLNRQDILGVSVAGSHGKTTTTAMLASALSNLGEDPSYLVGTSDIGALGQPGKYGKGKYFVVESDEYVSDLIHDPVPKFHYQHPYAAIITNIDFDHPDVFSSIEDIYHAFRVFIQNIQQEGILIVNSDDKSFEHIQHAVRDDIKLITIGESSECVYNARNISITEEGITYSVFNREEKLGEIKVSVIGKHNVLNSLSVVALLHTMGKSFSEIAESLQSFSGTKRRLELKGVTSSGQIVIDDYAHHPTEISATLDALKQAYPDKKIVCIFQPHTYSRTQSLVNEFASSLKKADILLLLPIFTSARENAITEAQQKQLYDQILDESQGVFLETQENVVEYCVQNLVANQYIIVTMGAGNVYKISEKLLGYN